MQISVLLGHNMAAIRCVFQTLPTLHTLKTWIIIDLMKISFYRNEIDEDNPLHEQQATQLLEALLMMIEEKANEITSDDKFLFKIKAQQFQVLHLHACIHLFMSQLTSKSSWALNPTS